MTNMPFDFVEHLELGLGVNRDTAFSTLAGWIEKYKPRDLARKAAINAWPSKQSLAAPLDAEHPSTFHG